MEYNKSKNKNSNRRAQAQHENSGEGYVVTKIVIKIKHQDTQPAFALRNQIWAAGVRILVGSS